MVGGEQRHVESAPLTGLESGWYGFCFGSRRRRNPCHCTGSLTFSGKDHQLSYIVPFELDGRPIYSLNYGRLVYCDPDTKVEMKYKEICPYHESRPLDLQWCLVARHLSAVAGFVGGELSDRKKCLVCSTCGDKTFAQIQSAEKHYRDAHKIFPADSIWNKPLDILYDDEDVAVINKPQGMSVQGGEGKCLQKSDLILPLAKKIDGNSFVQKPIIVHRLDAATGGLLVLAKSKDAEKHLKMSFTKRECKKRYRAVVFGKVKNTCDNKIGEPISGKPSETYYEVVRQTRCAHPRANGWITTLDLRPVSGRKHQIRKHLKHIGHPIWGDQRYANYPRKSHLDDQDDLSDDEKVDCLHRINVKEDAHARLCLWATEICFPHPQTATPVQVTLSEEPKWIKQLLEYQERLYYTSCKVVDNHGTVDG